MTDSQAVSQRYTGHAIYRLLTALCVLLTLAFAWQLFTSWDGGALLFLVISAWSTVRCYVLMSSEVLVAADSVRVLVPLRTPHEVAFRQMTEVYEEGRGLKRIFLLYYPRSDAGIVTTDEECTLELPAVNNHDALLAALRAHVPA